MLERYEMFKWNIEIEKERERERERERKRMKAIKKGNETKNLLISRMRTPFWPT